METAARRERRRAREEGESEARIWQAVRVRSPDYTLGLGGVRVRLLADGSPNHADGDTPIWIERDGDALAVTLR